MQATRTTALDAMMRKFDTHAELSDDDRHALAALPFTLHARAAGTYLAREGQVSDMHIVLLSGYAYRHKLTGTGARQIVSLQIPGEAVACSSLFFDPADHSTQALTAIDAAFIPKQAFRDIVLSRPAIGHAILLMTLIEGGIANEWMLNLGRRSAKVRVAHLLCEFAARIDAAGLSDGTDYDLPLTQEQLGDALGLTPVHVNRMLRELGTDGLVVRSGRQMTFPDRPALEQLADFDGAYLRMQPRKGRGPTENEAGAP